MIRAAIFDLDGLLIDSEPFWEQAEIEVFGSVGLALTRDTCKETMGMRIDDVVQFRLAQHPWDTNRFPSDNVRDRIIDRVIELIESDGRALPGVYTALDFFTSRGLPLAVASSSHLSIIDAAVRRLKIAAYFRVLQSAEPEPLGKPHPAVFLNAAAALDIPAEDCLVFEDSVTGLIAAKAARMVTVAVPDADFYDDPRYSIAELKLSSLADFNSGVFDLLNESLR